MWWYYNYDHFYIQHLHARNTDKLTSIAKSTLPFVTGLLMSQQLLAVFSVSTTHCNGAIRKANRLIPVLHHPCPCLQCCTRVTKTLLKVFHYDREWLQTRLNGESGEGRWVFEVYSLITPERPISSKFSLWKSTILAYFIAERTPLI